MYAKPPYTQRKPRRPLRVRRSCRAASGVHALYCAPLHAGRRVRSRASPPPGLCPGGAGTPRAPSMPMLQTLRRGVPSWGPWLGGLAAGVFLRSLVGSCSRELVALCSCPGSADIHCRCSSMHMYIVDSLVRCSLFATCWQHHVQHKRWPVVKHEKSNAVSLPP